MTKLFEKKSQCCGCGVCKEICANEAIEMAVDREGFSYPKVNKKNCVGCGKCKAVCPLIPCEEKGNGGGRIYLGTQAKDDSIRFSSTSGGVFPVLAQHVLSGGGVVFGAAMDSGGRVFHKDIQRMEELGLLQKSKYVQSEMSGCYKKIERYLKAGRQVLFTGTPCQCQAVKQFIGGESDKLLVADLVCYGVPSPQIWKKYLRELEIKYHGTVSDFCFRDKREKNNGHTISLNVGNKEYSYSMDQDLFCKLYFQNYIIRPSCHSCKFCTVERGSDITMGDFWGIEKIKPDMKDGMGTSLVILHNEKAYNVWKSVESQFRYFQCEKEDILQPRLCSPASQSKRRKMFMVLSRILPLVLAERIVRR